MPLFFGNTATNATSTAYDLPSKIVSYSLVNRTGGAITVNAGILYGSTIYFAPQDAALAAGEAYIYSGNSILLPAGYRIYIATSGSCDYVFTLESVEE